MTRVLPRQQPLPRLWKLQILKSFKEIIVESDTKVCIDAVSVNPDKAPWKIQTLVANISI
jgi:hypothetical protein